MPQQFITQIEEVCRRRYRRNWLMATCWVGVAVLLGALALIGLDRGLGIADPAGRALLSLSFAIWCLYLGRRWWNEVSAYQASPLQVAHEIEVHHPRLMNVVANAWEFAQQSDDPTAGSPELRRAIVLQAATAVDEVDWWRLVARKPLKRALYATVSLAIAVALLVLAMPQTMGIGIARLTNPFNTAEWPREHDLCFIEPPQVLAAGADFVVTLRDSRRKLPATVEMHYRTFRQGRWQEETQILAATADELEIRWPNVQRSFQYRATGGDHHNMPWQSLKVMVPPYVEDWQLTVHPPAYTNLPAYVWDQSAPIYARSRLGLQGITDKPITQISLHSDGGQGPEVQLSEGGRSFRVEPSDWLADASETYTMQLTTAAGLSATAKPRISFSIQTDQPPQVRFVEPQHDLTVLPTSLLRLVIEAVDDFSVESMELVYHRSDRPDEGEQRITLWQTTAEAGVQGAPKHQVDFPWQLEKLACKPGSTIELHAQALDAQPMTGQTVRPLQLRIVSEEQLWDQISKQQEHVVEMLFQLLSEQRELRGITKDWRETPTGTALRWAAASNAALYRQRMLADSLAGGQPSVKRLLIDVQETIELNQLLRPTILEPLQTAIQQIEELTVGPLNTVESSLSKLARLSHRGQEPIKPQALIQTIGAGQQQAMAGMQSLIGLLTPGSQLGRLQRELNAIETDQRTLAERCRVELSPALLPSKDRKPDDQARLASAVRSQRELSRRLADLIADMQQTAQDLADQYPVVSTRLADTTTFAAELGVQATIQSAAEQLARRRLGRSAMLQRQTLEDLARLRERLAGQDVSDGAKRLEQLQAVERQLQRLRRQVSALEKELRQLGPEQRQRALDRLRREREKLAEQTESLVRRLEQLRLTKTAETTKQAAANLRRSQLDAQSTKQARQQLDEAQRQLTTTRRRQQVALARLQMAKLDAKLSFLVGRQQAIHDEIGRLSTLLESVGQLNPPQVKSVFQLSLQQTEVREEVLTQADALTTLPVFAHLLNIASQTMQGVEERLQQNQVDGPTKSLANEAIQQLTRLAEAVRQEQQNQSPSDSGGGGGGGQTGDTAQRQTLQLALGQLKLLKALQTELFERTQLLEAQTIDNQQVGELARRQRELSELAQQLVPEPADPPTEDLFPDFDQELERSLDDFLLPETNQE